MVSASFKTLFALAALAASVTAGPSNGRFTSQFATRNAAPKRRATEGSVNIAYLPNWKADFRVKDLTPETITHVLYSFVDVDATTGALKLSDPAVDISNTTSGPTLDGQLGDLFELKRKNRHLKTLVSIGGWTYSKKGNFGFLSDSKARATFVKDAVRFLEDYGLDGIDVDYEAQDEKQADDITALFKELRAGLDKHAEDKAETVPYLLTSAVFITNEPWTAKATEFIDYFLVMAYDLSGSWVKNSAYHSNLLSDGNNDGLSVDAGIQKFLSHTPSSRIVMGQPLYGWTFGETEGINKPFNGTGSGELNGLKYYKDLPASGADVVEDLKIGGAYTYDKDTEELVVYDTPAVTKMKAAYIKENKLAGSMWWDASTDKIGDDSLIATSAKELGALEQSDNHINYPDSAFDNVKEAGGDAQTPGGGGGGATTSTDVPSSTDVPTSTDSPTATPTGTTCPARRKQRRA